MAFEEVISKADSIKVPKDRIYAAGKASGPRWKAHNSRVINKQLTRVAEAGNPEELFKVIGANLQHMNGINLATALHRLAKLPAAGRTTVEEIKDRPIFCELFDKIVQHVVNHSLRSRCENRKQQSLSQPPPKDFEMPVQCMSIVAWSCATMQIRCEALLEAIADVTSVRLDDLKPFELSNLVWAFAKMSMTAGDLFKNSMRRLLCRKAGEFKVQCLAMVAWAFATAERRGSVALFASIGEELIAQASEMKPQEISSVLWAFAKMRFPNAALFEAVGNAAMEGSKLCAFKPQELSNTAWAFATVGIRHEALLEKLELSVARRCKEFNPQVIANLLWAFAKLRAADPVHGPKNGGNAVFLALLEAAATCLPEHKPQELCATVWAAAQVCPGYSEFFITAARGCSTRLHEFSPNALANLAKAFAAISMNEHEMLHQILQEAVRRLGQFKPPALVNVLQVAMGAASDPQLEDHAAELDFAVTAISQQLTARIDEFQPDELAEVLGGLQRYCSRKNSSDDRQGLQTLVSVVQKILQESIERTSDNGEASTVPPSVGSREDDSPEDDEDLSSTSAGDACSRPGTPSGSRTIASRSGSPTAVAHNDLHGNQPARSQSKTLRFATELGSTLLSSPSPVTVQLSDKSSLCDHLNKQARGKPSDPRSQEQDFQHIVPIAGEPMHVPVPTYLQTQPGFSLATRSGSTASRISNTPPHAKPTRRDIHVHTSADLQHAIAGDPYCAYVSLPDWLAWRLESRRPVLPAEAAKITRSVLSDVEALLPLRGVADTVRAVGKDAIFMDAQGTPKIHKAFGGHPHSADEFKWYSPEEVAGALGEPNLWLSLSYRLGLLLYCLGSRSCRMDPYPGKSGEQVLSGLQQEVYSCGLPIRPNLDDFTGTDMLRNLVAACLRIDGQPAPDYTTLTMVLEIVSACCASGV